MFPAIQRSVVISSPVPRPVQVVRHHVDEVQVLRDLPHVVSVIDPELGGGDRGRQEPVVRLEGGGELLHQAGKVLLVVIAAEAEIRNRNSSDCNMA